MSKSNISNELRARELMQALYVICEEFKKAESASRELLESDCLNEIGMKVVNGFIVASKSMPDFEDREEAISISEAMLKGVRTDG